MLATEIQIKTKFVPGYGRTLSWNRGKNTVSNTGETSSIVRKDEKPSKAIMSAAKTRRKYSDEEILELHKEYVKSGMPAKAFARSAGFNEGTFQAMLTPKGRLTKLLAKIAAES